jgi:hypothetical protein
VLCARGYAKKIFVGKITPQKRAKPLILLGLLISNMHADAGDDKKFFNFFSQAVAENAPSGPSPRLSNFSMFFVAKAAKGSTPHETRNRSAEDDASVRATSLTK